MNNLIIRLLDIISAILGIIICGIPMIIIAIMIKKEDGHSVLFLQKRVGLHKKKFMVYKFRTMTVPTKLVNLDTENLTLKEMASKRATFKTTQENDRRITRIGRIIRPAHLDELPQFFNVLFGHMSLVGPRPDTPIQEVDYTSEYWDNRHSLRPGITGPAQLKSNIADLSERTLLELHWLEAPTVKMYFQILLSTIKKVISRTGN